MLWIENLILMSGLSISLYNNDDLGQVLDENNQLISIFVKSIETAQKNNMKSK